MSEQESPSSSEGQLHSTRTVARPHRLAIPSSTGLVYIEHGSIMHLQADRSYTLINCTEGFKYLVSESLAMLEKLLPSRHFFRCHRSHVINLAMVQQLILHGGYRVQLPAGYTVEVARRRLAALKEALARA